MVEIDEPLLLVGQAGQWRARQGIESAVAGAAAIELQAAHGHGGVMVWQRGHIGGLMRRTR